ncbi:MAG: zinc ribbon domain-containing protein [Candidatus Accumulibacter sp. UW25]|jgi:putative FmdB family regulatory protein
MPIYAYRCTSCGFERDHLQKLSDPLLELCPQCGEASYRKQVTAAGFQLKGNGWYATDFKGGNKPAPSEQAKSAESAESAQAAGSAEKTTSTASAGSSASKAGTAGVPASASPTGASACAGN